MHAGKLAQKLALFIISRKIPRHILWCRLVKYLIVPFMNFINKIKSLIQKSGHFCLDIFCHVSMLSNSELRQSYQCSWFSFPNILFYALKYPGMWFIEFIRLVTCNNLQQMQLMQSNVSATFYDHTTKYVIIQSFVTKYVMLISDSVSICFIIFLILL